MGSRDLTDEQAAEVNTFLREVARRKAKPKTHFVDLRKRHKANPVFKVIKLDDGTKINLTEAVAQFTLCTRKFGRQRFAILSDGQMVAEKIYAGPGVTFPCIISRQQTNYFEGASVFPLSKAVVDTMPDVVPKWVFDLMREGRVTGADFEDQFIHSMATKLLRGLTDEVNHSGLVTKLLVGNGGLMQQPLASFYNKEPKGLRSYAFYAVPDIVKNAVFRYLENLGNPWEFPFPGDPVWQISIKDLISQYIAEKEIGRERV